MAAELISPTDELTGMPLSVAPPLEPLDRNASQEANWHHLWHPRLAPQLQSLGGNALRNSRVQLLPVRDHNVGRATYHTYYVGPPLPEEDDADQQFALCLLACAGYVPNQVIDLHTPKGPTVRTMTDGERKAFDLMPAPQTARSRDITWYRRKMLEEGSDEVLTDTQIRERINVAFQRQAAFSRNNFHYAYEPLRQFFESYLISERMLDVSPRQIKRFLSAKDETRRVEMGERLLTRASVVSTSGLLQVYRQLYHAGVMNRNMPPAPMELVRDKLGNPARRQRLIPKLVACLESALDGVQVA